MTVCPVCNGLQTVHIHCENCGSRMTENGKLMDYFGSYSPYMEIDLMKLTDGIKDSYSEHKCPHLYHCPHCGIDEIVLINE